MSRILIIDSDKVLLESLKMSLEAEAYAVDTVHDGEKGSYVARTNDYDVVLMDVLLPNKQGYQVCTDIRNAGKNVPILAISAVCDCEIKTKLLDAGADDYVTKPFSFDELRARLRALLRRPRHMLEKNLVIDNLSMDIDRQTVKRGKKDIYLTRKEFSLLEFLIKNRGRVVSRGMIMEHVWNLDSDPFSNTIEAHILNLRRKIETPRWKKLIHNVAGRGYKVDVIERK